MFFRFEMREDPNYHVNPFKLLQEMFTTRKDLSSEFLGSKTFHSDILIGCFIRFEAQEERHAYHRGPHLP